MHVINGDSARTTFQSNKGSSNIDLNTVKDQMLAAIKNWEISEEESCSDHNIMAFNLNFASEKAQIYTFQGTRYIIKEREQTEFYKNLLRLMSANFHIENDKGNSKGIAENLNTNLKNKKIGAFVEKFNEAISQHARKRLSV